MELTRKALERKLKMYESNRESILESLTHTLIQIKEVKLNLEKLNTNETNPHQ